MSHATWRSREPGVFMAPLGEPQRSITGRSGSRTTAYRLVAGQTKMVRSSWQEAGIFILAVLWRRKPPRSRQNDPIAQLDRVADFYSAGCRFESCWDRQRSKPSPFPSMVWRRVSQRFQNDQSLDCSSPVSGTERYGCSRSRTRRELRPPSVGSLFRRFSLEFFIASPKARIARFGSALSISLATCSKSVGGLNE